MCVAWGGEGRGGAQGGTGNPMEDVRQPPLTVLAVAVRDAAAAQCSTYRREEGAAVQCDGAVGSLAELRAGHSSGGQDGRARPAVRVRKAGKALARPQTIRACKHSTAQFEHELLGSRRRGCGSHRHLRGGFAGHTQSRLTLPLLLSGRPVSRRLSLAPSPRLLPPPPASPLQQRRPGTGWCCR